MKHARADYDSIQDASGKIPDDEPVFLLRAQDIVAPNIVRQWASLALVNGVDRAMVDRALAHADRMQEWQRVHGRKIPDMPS